MNNDSMRYNLVTTFICTQCGSKLRLTYDDLPKQQPYQPEADCGITGAAMRSVRVGIHPCAKCYGAAVKPMRALKEAIDAAANMKEQA